MTEPTESLKSEIKKLVVDTLSLTDTDPETILDEPSFFTGENTITLDSIDAIELIMAVQRTFSVRLDDQNLAREIITSVNNIAHFIAAERNKDQA